MNAARVEALLDVVNCARALPMQTSSNFQTQKALHLARQAAKKWLVECVLLEMKCALRVVGEEPEQVGV